MKNELLNRMNRYRRGYIKIRITGSNAERFLNLCQHQELRMDRICREGCNYTAVMPADDYFRLRPVIRKTGIRPEISEKRGLPFLLRKNRKRKVLLLCAVLFAGLLYYLSGFLWRIEYEGCYYHTKEQLQSFLEECGIYEGVRKREASCPEIEEKIRSRFTDIGWVSAEISGTVMKIRIKETKMPKLNADKAADGFGEIWQEETGHIVAASDGIVMEISVASGSAQVRAGDVVRRGQILISGVLDVFGDNETLVERRPVLAQGSVVLKTTENYDDRFPLDYEKRVYSGRKKTGLRLELAGIKIFSYSPSNSYPECDIISEMEQYCIGDSFFLPFKAWKTTVREYYMEPAVYSEEEARIAANERLIRYLTERKEGGATLLSSEVSTELEKNACHTSGLLIFQESAWKYRTVNPDEWRLEEGNEHYTEAN